MYIELTKNIYNKMISHQFVLSVMGNFNQDFLRSIIRMTEKRLESFDIGDSTKRRIFHFMVECAQNLCKYDEQCVGRENNLFLIGKRNNEYVIYLGCVCGNEETTEVKKVVDLVNTMQLTEVKDKFYNEMTTGNSLSNALLLSVLDITKRTKEKINYEIISVNGNDNFLCFKTSISNF